MTPMRYAAIAAGIVLAFACRSAIAAPTDIVPRGDIAYDLFGSLAAQDMVPDYTARDFLRGDRLYTRMEMTRILVRISQFEGDLTPKQRMAYSVLAREFMPELRALDAPMARFDETPASGETVGAGSYRLLGHTDPTAAEHIVRGAGAAQVGRDGYAALSAGTWRKEFNGDDFTAVETAYVRINGRALDVTVGRRPMRWGPGYAGALLLSDESESVPMIQIEKSFVLPGWAGKRLGRLYFRQFAGTFNEDTPPPTATGARNGRRYLLARRLETDSGGRWNVSLSESFKSRRLPNPIAANLLPFYTYQNDWTESGWFSFLASKPLDTSNWINYIASAGASYRADAAGTTFFADLLVDDAQAPKGLKGEGKTPRKLGVQLGVHAPDLGGQQRYSGRLEFATIDPTTYTTDDAAINWDQDDRPLGYVYGRNVNVAFGRFDARFTNGWAAAVDATVQRRRSSSEPGVDAERANLYASYAWRPNAFIGGQVGHDRVKVPGQGRHDDTHVALSAGIAF